MVMEPLFLLEKVSAYMHKKKKTAVIACQEYYNNSLIKTVEMLNRIRVLILVMK